jgi:hypothetical protein
MAEADDKIKAELLTDTWTLIEKPSVNMEHWIELFKCFTERKELLMTEEEFEFFNNLPEEITIYRGAESIEGISWTLSEEKAKWFAKRFERNGKVFEKSVKKSDCLCYLNDREEQEDHTLMGSYKSETLVILDLLVQNFQEDLWSIIIDTFENTKSAKTYLTIADWFRGDYAFNEIPGSLELFDKNLIFNWIDEDISSKAPLMARYVPRYLKVTEKCLAREILIKYGGNDDVKKELYCNFGSGGHVGPQSQYLTEKKESFESYLKDEKNANVIKWVKKYIEYLEQDIKQSKIEEEREF